MVTICLEADKSVVSLDLNQDVSTEVDYIRHGGLLFERSEEEFSWVCFHGEIPSNMAVVDSGQLGSWQPRHQEGVSLETDHSETIRHSKASPEGQQANEGGGA